MNDSRFSVLSDHYDERVKKHTPPSHLPKNGFFAFLIGGLICALGEALAVLYSFLGIEKETVYPLVSVSMIFFSALLTGLGVYDRIARTAGAGTLVPITGFANAVVSPAIDTKSEGIVVGVGSKIFTVAGPVILFAVLSGTLYGIVYALFFA